MRWRWFCLVWVLLPVAGLCREVCLAQMGQANIALDACSSENGWALYLARLLPVPTEGDAKSLSGLTSITPRLSPIARPPSTTGAGNGTIPTTKTSPANSPDIRCLVNLTNQTAAGGSVVYAWLQRDHIGPFHPWPATNTVQMPDVPGQVSLDPEDWKFYVFTNDTSFANLAFLTFIPDPACPGGGQPLRVEPDIDLYVSTDSELTNLVPQAVQSAWKSLSRGGTETVLRLDGTAGTYYIGVKSESPSETEFSLVAAASEQPFSEQDPSGNLILHGFPLPSQIPQPEGCAPGVCYAMMVTSEPVTTHHVIVSNQVSHTQFPDLRGQLRHNGIAVSLNQNSQVPPGTWNFIWDDSGLGSIPDSQPTPGPGSLLDFTGTSAAGQWLLIQEDTQPGESGTNDSATVVLQPAADGLWASVELPPGTWDTHSISVPPGATNLTLSMNLTGDTTVTATLCRSGDTMGSCQDATMTPETASATLAIDKYSNPPLNAGEYYVRLRNEGALSGNVDLVWSYMIDDSGSKVRRAVFTQLTSIPDSTETSLPLTVTNSGTIVSINPGVRLQHPRVSDLEISLISPSGTTVLLSANRGGDSPDGFGLNTTVTNTLPVSSSGGPEASTNIIDVGVAPGFVAIEYHFYDLADDLRIYRGSNLLFHSGLVSGDGFRTLAYGMDLSGEITVVINEGDNYNTNTAWDYIITTTRPGMVPATFTENTSLTTALIKFAPPPFTNVTWASSGSPASNVIAFIPEQPLSVFAGEAVEGDWKLRIRDTHEGPSPADVPPLLFGWDLHFILEDKEPLPQPLQHATPLTNILRGGQWSFYVVDVPLWAGGVTNTLVFSSAPVSFWYGSEAPPVGTNATDTLIAASTTSTTQWLATDTEPPLAPGGRYYLGVQNPNAATVNIAVRADFQVPVLPLGSVTSLQLYQALQPQYFAFDIPESACGLMLSLTNVSGNVDVVVRKDLPLPTLTSFDYGSFSPETNSEQILITPDSLPVPLSPGTWYLGVFNMTELYSSGDLVLSKVAPSLGISMVDQTTGLVRMDWRAPTSAAFQIEWSPSLSQTSWTPFPEVITSITGDFEFQDTAFQDTVRFYRLVQLP
jgi:subtilisin-like proprotein convertase family protein